MNSATARTKLDEAAAATDTVQELVDHAIGLLQTSFNGRIANGHGVYANPSLQRANLRGAVETLQKAMQRMDETQWPTSADYDAA